MSFITSTLKGLAEKMGYAISAFKPRIDLGVYEQLFGADAVRRRAFYNVGAGGFSHPAWTNIDADSDWYGCNRKDTLRSGNLQHDLLSLKPLPIESDSASIIYSSHTIEHVTNEADEVFFRDAHRVLKQGGIVRITTNSTDLAYRAYRSGDRRFFYWSDWYRKPEEYKPINLKSPLAEASLQQLFLFDFASQLTTVAADGPPERLNDGEVDRIFNGMPYEEALDHCRTRCLLEVQKRNPGYHLNWFNADKIVRMLRAAGFKDVYVSGWCQSVTPVLRDPRHFDKTHPRISIYVEGVK